MVKLYEKIQKTARCVRNSIRIISLPEQISNPWSLKQVILGKNTSIIKSYKTSINMHNYKGEDIKRLNIFRWKMDIVMV